MTEFRKPRLTTRINLRGGQERLREMILYVAQHCATAERFGAIKLNKILWKADFDAFAARGVPVTGRQYHRLHSVQAPERCHVCIPTCSETSLIRVERINLWTNERGEDIIELRTIAQADPNVERLFNSDDLRIVSMQQSNIIGTCPAPKQATICTARHGGRITTKTYYAYEAQLDYPTNR